MQDLSDLLARAGLQADRLTLVRLAGELVSDEMLEQIARADYGHDAALNLRILRFVRDERAVAKLSWQEREVLELVRWSLPEAEATREAQLRAHAMRLFACAVLVSDGDPLGDSEIQTLAPLLDSLSELGKKNLINAGTGLLLFRLQERTAGPEARPFFAFGLLLLLALGGAQLHREEWELLGAWIIDEESVSRAASALFSGPWLLGATYFDARHGLWRRLGNKLLCGPTIAGLELLSLGVREWNPPHIGS